MIMQWVQARFALYKCYVGGGGGGGVIIFVTVMY